MTFRINNEFNIILDWERVMIQEFLIAQESSFQKLD